MTRDPGTLAPITRDEFARVMIPSAVATGRWACRYCAHLADEGESIAYVALAEAMLKLPEPLYGNGWEKAFVRWRVLRRVRNYLSRRRESSAGPDGLDLNDPRDHVGEADADDAYRFLVRPAPAPRLRKGQPDLINEGLALVDLRFRVGHPSLDDAARVSGFNRDAAKRRYYPALAVVRERALTMTEGDR